MSGGRRLPRLTIALAVLAIVVVDSASTTGNPTRTSELVVETRPSDLTLAPGESATFGVDAELILVEATESGRRVPLPGFDPVGDLAMRAAADGVTVRAVPDCPDVDQQTSTACTFEVIASDQAGRFQVTVDITAERVSALIEESTEPLPDAAVRVGLDVTVAGPDSTAPSSTTPPATTTAAPAPPTTVGCPQIPPEGTESATAGPGAALGAETVVASAPGAVGSYSDGVSTVRIEGTGAIHLAHTHSDAAWTPCVDGPVESIRFEMTGSAASVGDTGQIAMRPMVTQNGSVFVTGPWFLRPPDGTAAFAWDVTAADFSRITGTATLDLVDGPPIGFGYTVAVSCPETATCTTVERSFTLQRWAMQITPG
jgi:hypothetical protein